MRDFGSCERGEEPRLRHRQQRANDEDRAFGSDWNRGRIGHAAEAGETAAPRESKQHRLGLIVERVGCEDVFVAGADRGIGEHAVAGDPRRLLHAGLRLRSAPRQRAVRNREPTRKRFHGVRFAPCFRT